MKEQMARTIKKIAPTAAGKTVKDIAEDMGMEYNEARRVFQTGMAKVSLTFLRSAMGDFRPGDVKRKKREEEALHAIRCAHYEEGFTVLHLFSETMRERMIESAWFKSLPEECRDHIEEAVESLEMCQKDVLEALKKEKER